VATILAHIEIHPGQERDFESLAVDLFQETSQESGKKHYEYWRGAKAGLYYCLLAFDDFHAFLVHQTSDHHEEASPRLGELIARMKLEWVDPVQGASTLPATTLQPLPPNSSPLMSRYHALFSPELQDWWQPLRSQT
jgi:quinol monooxygenase YgiN